MSVEVFIKVIESVFKRKPVDHVQQLYSQAIKHCADTPGFINFDSLLSPVRHNVVVVVVCVLLLLFFEWGGVGMRFG